MNLALLSATLLALLSGPLLYAGARDRPALLAFLDGFVLVAISGLVFMEVLPETLESGGQWALFFLAAGALGPTMFEHQLHNARQAHVAALLLAIGGLVLHSIGDGTALAPHSSGAHGGDEPRIALALAISVHSVPVGLVVWWLLYPVFGALLPSAAIVAMCLGTLAGYIFADDFSGWLGATGWAWLQALVAGSMLHVVFGRPHLEETSSHRHAPPPFEGLGNLTAVAALALLETLDPPSHHSHPEFLQRLLDLSLACAPGLLAAYLIAGIVGSTLADRRAVATSASWPPLRGLADGLSVAAASQDALPGYRQKILFGGSMVAALVFLLIGSELALAALLISVPLLGWQLMALRVVAALTLALAVALTVGRLFPPPPRQLFRPSSVLPASSLLRPPSAVAVTAFAGFARTRPAIDRTTPALNLVLRHGLVARVDETAPWMLICLLLAAWITPFLENPPWALVPTALQVPAFALLGLLLSASATGATVLAAVLIAAGVSPGASMAFLLSGPAAHPRLLARLRALHGSAFAAGFAAAVFAATVAIGCMIDAWLAPSARTADAAIESGPAGIVQMLCLLALSLVYAGSLLRRGGREFFGSVFPIAHRHEH